MSFTAELRYRWIPRMEINKRISENNRGGARASSEAGHVLRPETTEVLCIGGLPVLCNHGKLVTYYD